MDVVHVTMKPPFIPGSFNRMIRHQMRHITSHRQRAISYWDGELPDDPAELAHVTLIQSHGLTMRQRCFLKLPRQIRKRMSGGISDRKWLTYLWGLVRHLRQLRPKLVICYDCYQLGSQLKKAIDWPCRVALSQHGLSYYLDTSYAQHVYSLRSFDVVHTLTHASYRFDRSRIPIYEPEVAVIPDWVDTRSFFPANAQLRQECRAAWQLPPDKRIVLWLSRLVPAKGAHLVISCWPKVLERLPDAFLWIVGGRDESWSMRGYDQYLRNLIDRLGLQQSIRLQGACPPEKTPTCYQASDAYVFPSVFVEGFALTLLEAMASGVPCVASEYEIGRELYSDREVLFVPDPNLANAFAAPLVRVLEDGELRRDLVQGGLDVATQRYSFDRVAPQISAFYDDQIGKVATVG